MKNIKELIEAHTTEEGINYEKAEEAYQKHINDIVAKKTDPEKLTAQAVEKLAGELGVEAKTVDDLKTYIKKMGGSTDDIKEANIKLEKELAKERQAREEIESQYKQTQEEIKVKNQMGKLKALGLDDERAEFLHYKLNKQVSDEKDFDAVLEDYTKEHDAEFRKETTSFKRKRDQVNPPSDGDMDVFSAWEEKYSKK